MSFLADAPATKKHFIPLMEFLLADGDDNINTFLMSCWMPVAVVFSDDDRERRVKLTRQRLQWERHVNVPVLRALLNRSIG